MKTLYLDLAMGVAGDMLTAALVDLFDDKEKIVDELNKIGIPDVEYKLVETSKCGIKASHMEVLVSGVEEDEHLHDHHDHQHHHDHEHHHSHSNLEGIRHIIKDHLNINDNVKNNALKVYDLLAKAESEVHGMKMDEIHFHEVGSKDAIADIVAVAYLIDKLNIDNIISSSIHVGKGYVKCAHGILPVPTPATSLILKGVPIYSKEIIDGELCTPTGAALVKNYAKEFKSMPNMQIDKIGYGAGKKDFPIANLVRVFMGESENREDKVIELDFNVDDMTGEEVGYLQEKLLQKAFEVFITPVQMKKNRPGLLISVLTSFENKDEVIKLIFKHSSTIGIRQTIKDRYILDRQILKENTSFGEIRIKKTSGYGVNKEKYEYEDLAKIANENDLSIKEVKDKLK